MTTTTHTRTQLKTAIVILSDPRSGGEEALGRLFNGLAAAHELKTQGGEVTLLFQGTGTRWLAELVKPNHPAHALFLQVQEAVAGASCGCADVFGARQDVERAGFEVVRDNAVPGTSGLPSLLRLLRDGYTILTF